MLWWAYDISASIRGSYYGRQQAFVLGTKMGLIVTALTSVVWSSLILRKKNCDTRQGTLIDTWQIGVVVAGYAVFVVGWRQFSGIR